MQNQYGCHSGRHIAALLAHLQHVSVRSHSKIVAIFLVIVGAYDRVGHDILIETMEKFDAPSYIVEFTADFYKTAPSRYASTAWGSSFSPKQVHGPIQVYLRDRLYRYRSGTAFASTHLQSPRYGRFHRLFHYLPSADAWLNTEDEREAPQ